MATIDVAELNREKLTDAAFPVPRQSDFRVAFVESVHRGINAHASEDTSVEICGVLVGSWARDADGPYAVIEHFIRCNAATQKFAEVTFTHESWAQINQEMDSKYQDLRIIGWYHSHPNFGIFLSDRDCFIQENFFSGPGQVAFVVDPVRKLEGLFEWRQGKPVPMHHYWIGGRVQVGETQPAPPPATMAPVAMMNEVPPAVPDSWSLALSVLLALCTGLLGLMWGTRRTAWEQERLEAGAVAHFGIWKVYKPGFEENLAKIIQAENQTLRKLRVLAEEQIAGAGEKESDVRKEWDQVYRDLNEISRFQMEFASYYGMSDSERREMRELLAAKIQELEGKELEPSSAKSPKESEEKPDSKAGASDSVPTAAAEGNGKVTPDPNSPSTQVEAGQKPAEKAVAPESPSTPPSEAPEKQPVPPSPSTTVKP